VFYLRYGVRPPLDLCAGAGEGLLNPGPACVCPELLGAAEAALGALGFAAVLVLAAAGAAPDAGAAPENDCAPLGAELCVVRVVPFAPALEAGAVVLGTTELAALFAAAAAALAVVPPLAPSSGANGFLRPGASGVKITP